MTIVEAAKIAAKAELARHYNYDSEMKAASNAFREALGSGKIARSEWAELKRQALLELEPTYCPACKREHCKHRECYRRLPESVGGLGLCPNLKKEG